MLRAMQLEGKLAVITGGATRVGRAIVEGLAEAGARPVVHYHHSAAEARELARRVGGCALQADLTQREGPGRLVEEVSTLGGELALWVNSAATFERRPFLDSDDELWERTLQLTLLAPARCSRAVAPLMVSGGLIVNVLDVAAHQPWRGYTHHCVAKAALLMLTRCLALELAPALRVCGVSPGLLLPAEGEEEAAWSARVQRVPLGRQGSPADVAQAIRYLAEADYVTGAVLPVDGGLTVRSVGG
jgi:pteridine reductase